MKDALTTTDMPSVVCWNGLHSMRDSPAFAKTEDLEELRSEKNLLMTSLEYTEDNAAGKLGHCFHGVRSRNIVPS